MKDLKQILFAIDFSECSTKAFSYGRDVAEKYGAHLHLLFVARDLAYLSATDVEPALLLEATNEIAGQGRKKMESFCKDNLKGFSAYTTKVVIGDPAEQILQYAMDIPVDLIVMGTHGRKGLDRILMGSVAQEVVRNASVPVLTVKP
jgi:nucleotide-binding universal stress UspA family protein